MPGRAAAAQLHRGLQAVVLPAGRHLHVGDHDVGAVGERAAQQVVGVAGLADHVESGVGQDPGDALAEQDVVLADGHPQGRARSGRGHRTLLATHRLSFPKPGPVRPVLDIDIVAVGSTCGLSCSPATRARVVHVATWGRPHGRPLGFSRGPASFGSWWERISRWSGRVSSACSSGRASMSSRLPATPST